MVVMYIQDGNLLSLQAKRRTKALNYQKHPVLLTAPVKNGQKNGQVLPKFDKSQANAKFATAQGTVSLGS